MRLIPLSDMRKGEKAVIKTILVKGDLRQRLMDIGFIEGTEVRCMRISPFGDPKAFLVRGAVIALRSEDSSGILGVKIE